MSNPIGITRCYQDRVVPGEKEMSKRGVSEGILNIAHVEKVKSVKYFICPKGRPEKLAVKSFTSLMHYEEIKEEHKGAGRGKSQVISSSIKHLRPHDFASIAPDYKYEFKPIIT